MQGKDIHLGTYDAKRELANLYLLLKYENSKEVIILCKLYNNYYKNLITIENSEYKYRTTNKWIIKQ